MHSCRQIHLNLGRILCSFLYRISRKCRRNPAIFGYVVLNVHWRYYSETTSICADRQYWFIFGSICSRRQYWFVFGKLFAQFRIYSQNKWGRVWVLQIHPMNAENNETDKWRDFPDISVDTVQKERGRPVERKKWWKCCILREVYFGKCETENGFVQFNSPWPQVHFRCSQLGFQSIFSTQIAFQYLVFPQNRSVI